MYEDTFSTWGRDLWKFDIAYKMRFMPGKIFQAQTTSSVIVPVISNEEALDKEYIVAMETINIIKPNVSKIREGVFW